MGALPGKLASLCTDCAHYKTYINTIDTEPVSRVYNKVTATKFANKQQMRACAIYIYEKATNEPKLSLKCAELVKELEDEFVVEGGEKHVFRAVFSEFMIPFLVFIIENYDDKYLNKQIVQSGIAISSFFGNLYNVDFYGIPQVVDIAQRIKKKMTPKSEFFMENMVATCSKRLESKQISIGFFEMMVETIKKEDYDMLCKNQPNDKRTDSKFYEFLNNMKTLGRHEFFREYEEFATTSEEYHKSQIKYFMEFIVDAPKFLNVYRYVALEIHKFQPEKLKINLNYEFVKAVEKYEVIEDIDSAENLKKFENLGKAVVEFHMSGLIDDEAVEYFLNIAKSSKIPIKIFSMVFVEALLRYEGKYLSDYFQYIQKKSKKMPDIAMTAAVVEDYIQHREELRYMDSKKDIYETGASSHPDLRDFSTKLEKHQIPFKCADRPACHIASQRGYDILMKHSGHKFFTPERIKICTKMTRKFSKISIEDRIRERMEQEMKVYLPYFKSSGQQNTQFRGFSNLLTVFYDEGIVRHEIIKKWMKLIYEAIRVKKNKSSLMEIYTEMFKKINNNFLSDDPNSWQFHSNFIDSCEYSKIEFDDFKIFKEHVEFCVKKSEFLALEKLGKVVIPNEKIAIRQISRFLVDFYVKENAPAAFVAALMSTLSNEYTPKLDENVLKLEFRDAICLKLGYIFAKSRKDGSKIHKDAVAIVELVEAMSIKSQLDSAKILKVVTKMAAKHENLYAIFNFIKFFAEKLKKVGSEKTKFKVEIEDIRNKLEDEFEIEDIECFQIREIREVFGDILSKRHKKMSVVGKIVEENGEIDLLGKQEHLDSTTTNHKPQFKNIKYYNKYCDYYNNINPRTTKTDKKLFNSNLISSLKITKTEQIIDFCGKFTERLLVNDSSVNFFVKSAIKIENIFYTQNKSKNREFSFKKILIDEINEKFKSQKILVEFMCELYNRNFVKKQMMIKFVDKFLNRENLILLNIFVKNCAVKLSAQGDEKQLIEIRKIAETVENFRGVDEDLKVVAQNLSSSSNSLIILTNNKKFRNENFEETVENLVKQSMKNPQISIKNFFKMDENSKKLLIQKCQSLLKTVPEIPVTTAEFLNFIEFLAKLYNFDILSTESINNSLDILLDSSYEEISCKSIEILFKKCALKMKKFNKIKLDICLNFFNRILAENENSVRSKYFSIIAKLGEKKFKIIENYDNFYENFLMIFSEDESNFEEIIEIFKCEEDEIDKFIQNLWKIILREEPNPSLAVLCLKTSKFCDNFCIKIENFLTVRCKTFGKILEDLKICDQHVKERLGKVVVFVVEIYNKNLVRDEILEMWIDTKLAGKIPQEFIPKIFNILSSCKRLERSKNDNLIQLVTNIDSLYYDEIEERINAIIDDL